MNYYVQPDETTAQAASAAANAFSWLPLVGETNGSAAPESQQMDCWCNGYKELTTGEWAILEIPSTLLTYADADMVEFDAFLAAYGTDIRSLTSASFVHTGTIN